MDDITHSGFIAIVGRPNVGKSTLLNELLQKKISITSHKPQTTRHRITGVKTQGNRQAIFVDTPGLHLNAKKEINKYMNKAAKGSLVDIDLVFFIVEALKFTDEDKMVAEILKNSNIKVALLVNKVDKLEKKEDLLPFIDSIKDSVDFDKVIPISATKNINFKDLEEYIFDNLQEGHAYFEKGQYTDKTNRFLVAEIIREKIMRTLDAELPYSITVEIEQFKRMEKFIDIHALIWVEREGQKRIIIGNKGDIIKEIGTQARKSIAKLLEDKINLKLWVKVKSGWSNNIRALKSLGYTEE